jgi:hypothetical protein
MAIVGQCINIDILFFSSNELVEDCCVVTCIALLYDIPSVVCPSVVCTGNQ